MKVPKEFKFYYSSDISIKYKIKICSLKGKRQKESAPETVTKWIDDPFLKNSSLYKDKTLDLYICCTLYSDGKPLCSPEQTMFFPFASGDNKWDETLIMPLKHQDLPHDTLIVFTIWDIYAPSKRVPIGGTSFAVFGRNRIERRGKHKLIIYQDVEGNGDVNSATPGQIQGKEEVYRLEKLLKKYDRNLIPHNDWLDYYAMREIDKITKNAESLNKNALYLTIELPELDLPILFKQQTCHFYKPIPTQKKRLVLVNDVEMNDHPCEQKYYRLNSYDKDDKDHKDLKPNQSEFRNLTNLLKTPPNTQFSAKDSILMWKFRYYLVNNKKALTKFLRCVEWNEAHQKNEALSILPKWEQIDVTDALELLSSTFNHKNTLNVRKYAVDILRKADDEELLYYLLQLVQATKYEPQDMVESPLISFLIERSTRNFSAKTPLGLKLRTKQGPEYGIIFKTGDDLRQDQLIIQMISLMDRLLKKENLDLKLTPYHVLATAEEDGIVEMVSPSEAMAAVINKYDGEILKYFKGHHPDPDAPLGVAPEVLDTFVKSCAGYCVITYILGIGDRHLDNLLLTPNGNLFHIDFGYILGKDPKIFPPPMKLCKEMVIGMGGENSKQYEKFKQYCCEAYNILRKSSHLIINLFALMEESNIPTISEEREKSILKVQEKFQLELNDQEAANSLLQLLNDSVSALFPVMVEMVHKWYQYWRN
ncbi:phosphatidylinositol 3-kinase [Heterostelium album PN500]|uniref:phosphatidylinositol 3-kinase n=1 Tax=Heterostelium pallidum (strain ATCC 26659 / Pp 5 / PN500) TaxID=670386 RepID=D3BPC8_HETP5|nr:phosphatidylinositol 3-kinase [Heterostelium album PN500]EFA77138.1 phosphatidylinositol 3-kinase [Heterostelium album PN500]|eukprot:XP_020429267.1 phosphatidylinositol 3-kinase [Heterostelium album PN500]